MHILLVEDSNADAYLLTEIFSRIPDAPAINWVTDGYDALDYVYQREKYAQARRPDFILLDLNLPRVDGFEVLKELKENPFFATIPIVILTTSRNPLDLSQSKALGADMCLSKPHAIRDYEDMVRSLIHWASLHVETTAAAVH